MQLQLHVIVITLQQTTPKHRGQYSVLKTKQVVPVLLLIYHNTRHGTSCNETLQKPQPMVIRHV